MLVCPSGFSWCQRGFYHCYLDLQRPLLAALDRAMAAHPHASIELTGHSLGGALSTLTAVDLLASGHPAGARLAPMHTFGSPRVGNPAFAAWASALLSKAHPNRPPQWRVVHYRDPVPHILLQALGFLHVPSEVAYDQFETNHKVCRDGPTAEDPTCTDGMLDWDLVDHLNYVRFDLVSNYLACKL